MIRKIAIYLRKSRADEDTEKLLGENETLSKHRKALLKLAKEKGYTVVKIYEEIVSGEKLIHRPQMLELLTDVEKGLYDAVLVMDMQRLGRGDMEDQGRILKSFKYSNTQIITPNKTYDLNNEFDEEYSEFEAFMSRKEYKMITRRMQSGRVRSIEEGNYLGSCPPFGYIIKEDKNSRTLVPHPEQAEILKLIFDMYVNQGMGCDKIAKELNKINVKSYTGNRWERTAISSMIKNEVYIGKIVWKKKCIRKSSKPNKSKDSYTRPREQWVISEGKHCALISEDIFNKAQEIIKNNSRSPYKSNLYLQNPLAGLIICKKCGYIMRKLPYKHAPARLICQRCNNKSTRFDLVEERIIYLLDEWLNKYNLQLRLDSNDKEESLQTQIYQKNVKTFEKELDELELQKSNIYDLFERKLYDENTFLDRINNVASRITTVKENINTLKEKIEYELKRTQTKELIIPRIKKVLDEYRNTNNIQYKNALLKTVLEKVEYLKEKHQEGNDFTLTIYPKILGI